MHVLRCRQFGIVDSFVMDLAAVLSGGKLPAKYQRNKVRDS
jgi:hypothetical protein